MLVELDEITAHAREAAKLSLARIGDKVTPLHNTDFRGLNHAKYLLTEIVSGMTKGSKAHRHFSWAQCLMNQAGILTPNDATLDSYDGAATASRMRKE